MASLPCLPGAAGHCHPVRWADWPCVWSGTGCPAGSLSACRSSSSPARLSNLLRAPSRLPRPPPAVRLLFPLGGAAVFLAGVGATFRSRALCQEVHANGPECVSPLGAEKLPAFDWATFWKFLRPQLLALTAAVLVRVGGLGSHLGIGARSPCSCVCRWGRGREDGGGGRGGEGPPPQASSAVFGGLGARGQGRKEGGKAEAPQGAPHS